MLAIGLFQHVHSVAHGDIHAMRRAGVGKPSAVALRPGVFGGRGLACVCSAFPGRLARPRRTMTVLLIVLTVLIVVVPLVAVPVGAFAIMKLQRQVIDKVTNVALEQRLQREGVATTAQVLDAADTGGRVDAIYLLVRLRLQVAAADGVEEFLTDIVAALSPVRVAQIVPGATVKVRVDPLSREVVLDQPRT